MTIVPIVPLAAVVFFGVVWVALTLWGVHRLGKPGMPSAVRLVRRLLLGLTLTLALLGPSVPAGETKVTTNIEIFFAIDRTGSMAAEDWDDGKPRLDGVKRDLQTLVTATAGSRYAVITWDSKARLELPVTTDSSAVISLAQALHQEISEFSAGSSINRPADELYELLASAKESRPGNVRYLVIFSDGESTDSTDSGVSDTWGQISGLVDGGAVLGYGTKEGGPMRIYRSGEGLTDEYMVDPSNPGEKAISHLDQEILGTVAEDVGVPLLINPSQEKVEELGATLLEDARQVDDGREMQKKTRYLVWPLGLVGAALVIWEFADFGATAARMRRSHAI